MSSRALALALLFTPALAAAADAPLEPQSARFALIVGVNHANEPGLATLRYADDDAAQYLDLFRLLGARTYLLTRLDENTTRLHPQAAAEARAPTEKELQVAVQQLKDDVARAKAQHVPTILYFVYAGHGNVDGEVGYLSLEDGRLTGASLAHDVLSVIDADQAHVIVDACYSYFLAFGRGPGGARRSLRNFTQTPELARDPRWGLLLSTSSAKESHEWDGFQAGVFSHEVRSGLYGAADADGDGWVSYPEMVAFIDRANAAIPNEKFRPQVFARPPQGTDRLADLRSAEGRRIEVDGRHAAHYLLEDGRGVRIADFHNAPSQAVHLLHPLGAGPLYLRRLDTDQEYSIAPAPDVVPLASLEPAAARARARGAAHDAFDLLFSLPFAEADVHPLSPDLALGVDSPYRPSILAQRQTWSVISLSLGALAGAGAGACAIAASRASSGVTATTSNRDAVDTNARLGHYNRDTAIFAALGGVAVGTGLVLWLWPDGSSSVEAMATPSGGSVAWTTGF